MWDTALSPSPVHALNHDTRPDPRPESAYTLDRRPVHNPCKKVMVSYDGSAVAEEALQVARNTAKESGAKLMILGVSPLPSNPSTAGLTHCVDRARERFSRRFHKIRLAGMNEGSQIETLIALGDVSELTWHSAERFHAQLIVVGCPGFREESGSTHRAERVSVVRVTQDSCARSRGEEISVCGPGRSNQEIE